MEHILPKIGWVPFWVELIWTILKLSFQITISIILKIHLSNCYKFSGFFSVGNRSAGSRTHCLCNELTSPRNASSFHKRRPVCEHCLTVRIIVCLNFWWFVRVTLVVAFVFLPPKNGRWQGSMNSILLFYKCRFSGGDTMMLWGRPNST